MVMAAMGVSEPAEDSGGVFLKGRGELMCSWSQVSDTQ